MAFDLTMSHPFSSGFTGGLGGPRTGGHVPPNWYIEYGMDLAAPAGTTVLAAFDAHVTRYTAHDPAADSGKVYGAQIFARSPNDMMGGFYTHLTDVPADLGPGSVITRGQPLGTVLEFGGISAHVHLALVEIIGGAPGGQYTGVDLYQQFLASGNTTTPFTVTFHQDGSTPTVGGGAPGAVDLSTVRGVQQALQALGIDPGPVDGLAGPLTAAAVAAFQAASGLPATGEVDEATRAALAAALAGAGLVVVGG